MHADGAGTKSSLAYMYWKETGDLSVWKGIAQDALIMNIDDLLCVGAVDNILVSSTIGRNKLLIPGEVISAIINGTDELLAELREMGVGVYATGGETADVGDLVRRYVLENMRENGYAIGGEQSGHVILLHHTTTGDGELTAGKLLKLLAKSGKKMSELNGIYAQ